MGYERDPDKAQDASNGDSEGHPTYLDDIAEDDINSAALELVNPLQEIVDTYNLTASQIQYMVDKMLRNELIKPSFRNI